MAMGVTTLLRVSLLVATCVVWVIAQQDEDPVIPEWLFASGEDDEDATNIITTRKPNLGWVRGGTSCLNSEECGRGKCCLRRYKSPRRRCRRFQRIGELCTEEQMMGGYYYGHCPCNKNGVCTYVGDAMRCVPKKEERPPEVPPQQATTPPPALPPKERPGPKPDSQESEESTTKPGSPAKPTGEITDNEIPLLPFETLTGPGEDSNVIPPLTPQGGGSRIPGGSNPPTASAPVPSSPNSIPMPIPTTNNDGRFGQGVNLSPPVSTSPQPGGTGTAGQRPRPPLVAPPPQSPNRPTNGPSTSTQGVPVPPPLPLPTSPGNVSPQYEGPQNSFPPPPITSQSSGLSPTTDQAGRPPSIPPSLPTNMNTRLPSSVEQKPPQLSQPPPTTEPGSNDFPPIVDDGAPPPPLPPSPLSFLNGRPPLPAQQ